MLRNILYRNQYIDHVFLIFPDGEICSAMRSPERMVNTYVIGQWYEETYTEHSRKMQLLPVHQADYYMGTRERDFTISRNIMNTSTIESASGEILGTLYIDISQDFLDNIIHETRLEDGARSIL